MKTYTHEQIDAELQYYNPDTNKLGGIAHQLRHKLKESEQQRMELKFALSYADLQITAAQQEAKALRKAARLAGDALVSFLAPLDEEERRQPIYKSARKASDAIDAALAKPQPYAP